MNNNNTSPSDESNALDSNATETPLPPEFVNLFNEYTSYKDTFDRLDEKLKNKLTKDARWAELFSGKEDWLGLFANHTDVGNLFTDIIISDRAKYFFPHLGWVSLFKEKKDILIKNFSEGGDWNKLLDDPSGLLELFAQSPNLAELFMRKSEYFNIYAGNADKIKKLTEKDGNWRSEFIENPEWAFVFIGELKEIERRRKIKEQNKADNDLIGLAFSGGGIRSASFGLGVLESLRDFSLLKKIDYLSTVSGGGYIGAWLSANCMQVGGKGISDWLIPEKKANEKEQLKENDKLKEEWNKSISHLRRYSNYLSPKVGLFSADTWTMAAVWLRNTLLIQLTVILVIAALLLIPRLLFPLFNWWPEAGILRWGSIFLFIMAVAGIAGNNWRVNRQDTSSQDGENWFLWTFAAVFLLVIAIYVSKSFDFNLLDIERDRSKLKELPIIFIAFLLVLSGSFLLPGILKLIKAFSGKNYSINYSQGLVQVITVLPIMAVGFFVAAILWKQSKTISILWEKSQLCSMEECGFYGSFLKNAWRYWPFPLMVVFTSLFILSFCCIGSGRKAKSVNVNGFNKVIINIKDFFSARWKNLLIAFLTALPAIAVLYVLLTAIMLLLHGWVSFDLEGQWRAFVWGPSLVVVTFALAVVVLLGMLGRDSIEGVREWWSRFGAWLAIYGFAWMAIMVIAVYGPLWGVMLYYDGPWKELGSGWIGTTIAGLFAGKSENTNGGADGKGISVKIKGMLAKAAPFVFIAGLLVVISTVLHLIIAVNSTSPAFKISQPTLLGDTEQPNKKLELQFDAESAIHIDVSASQANNFKPLPEENTSKYRAHWFLLTPPPPQSSQYFGVVSTFFVSCLGGFLLLAWRVDINEFSFNNFYRSRLARCFLGATRKPADRNPQNFINFDDEDDPPLADLAGSNGPYHIVNCALNLGGSSDLALHTRQSAIFTLTPLFCGSRYKIKGEELPDGGVEIGYVRTQNYCGDPKLPTLGQAIAVSGAAASPNMGYHTSPVTAFLMTLFNVRLGWWFPNPYKPKANTPSPSLSLRYLFMELFGLANEQSDFLSISDGGHFENLAVYELVKRQCKVIIASDGECDPNYQFEGLGTLIRMCYVDFGAKIDIDVRAIKREKDSLWSRSRCAVGTIAYADGSTGTLIYLKASMNGLEDTAVLQYKAAHSEFPHETTGDQFYSEDQFESYRGLGKDIAEKVFGKSELNQSDDMVRIADELHSIFSPELPNQTQFTRHADRLMEIWNQLREDEKLKGLDDELCPPNGRDKPERSIFYKCSEMLQLMENVYIDLNLEDAWDHKDNQGWMELFKKWAKSKNLKRTWELTYSTYGIRFQSFCEHKLKLKLPEDET